LYFGLRTKPIVLPFKCLIWLETYFFSCSLTVFNELLSYATCVVSGLKGASSGDVCETLGQVSEHQ